jgi:cytochrome P450
MAPGGLPGIGHMLQLGRRPMEFLESLRAYGPVVRVRVADGTLYMVNDHEIVRRILTDDAGQFWRGRFFDRLRPVGGNGIVISDGGFHRRQRRIMQPAFSRDRIAAYSQVMHSRAEAMASTWRDGQAVRADRAIRQHAVSIVTETMFSSALAGAATAEVNRLLPVINETMFLRAVTPRWLDRVPYPVNRRLDAATRGLHRAIDQVIAACASGAAGGDDLLSALLSSTDPDTGEGMDAEQVRDEAINILLAGSETPATTISWALHEISLRPEAQDRLRAEVAAAGALADPGGLPYARAVVLEALRLHSTLLNPRTARCAVELGGYRVPARSEVAFSPYALHRDPALFPEPARFRPDRWLADRSPGAPTRHFMPFGAGPHKCIGDVFAMTEAVITLAAIARRWRLEPAGGHVVRQRPGGMPRPSAVPLIVRAVTRLRARARLPRLAGRDGQDGPRPGRPQFLQHDRLADRAG